MIGLGLERSLHADLDVAIGPDHAEPSVFVAIIQLSKCGSVLTDFQVVLKSTRVGVTVIGNSWSHWRPQTHKVPSVRSATLVAFPAATERQLVSVPISTGLLRAVVVPSPSWPQSLLPQAHRLPSVLRART